MVISLSLRMPLGSEEGCLLQLPKVAIKTCLVGDRDGEYM